MKIEIKPRNVFIEQGEFANYLNFDFVIDNTRDHQIRLNQIIARFIDQDGKLLLNKYLDRNAMLPSIETIEQTEILPGNSVSLFNPFHTINPDILFQSIHYEFIAEAENGNEYCVDCIVSPIYYHLETELILPLQEKLLVYDGHEYLAHHRRVDLTHPMVETLGIRSNYVRYAVDFCVIDEKDKIYLNHGKQKEDWHSLGAKVYSPATGKVIFSQNDIPENVIGEAYAFEHLADKDNYLKLSLGNCVVIDHGNNEYSTLAHLMKGSVLVKNGDLVEQGQELAKVGFSGDTGSFVHLHYMLTNNYDQNLAEGIPLSFTEFMKIRGAEVIQYEKGFLETGEIVESCVKK